MFLDTAGLNARGHTTLLDAAFVGLPIVTVPSRSLATRIPSSMASQLPQLVHVMRSSSQGELEDNIQMAVAFVIHSKTYRAAVFRSTSNCFLNRGEHESCSLVDKTSLSNIFTTTGFAESVLKTARISVDLYLATKRVTMPFVVK